MTRRRSRFQRVGLGQWVDRGAYVGKSWQARRDYFDVLACFQLGVCVVCSETLAADELEAGVHQLCDPLNPEYYYRSDRDRGEDDQQREGN